MDQLLRSGKLDMRVEVTEMEELSSKSSRSSASIAPISALQHPKLLSKARTRTWGAAKGVMSRIGTVTGIGMGSMEDEIEAARREREAARLETATQRFLVAVTGRETLDNLRQESQLWYVKYLLLRLHPVWDALVVPAVAGISESQRPDDVAAMVKVFGVLQRVAESLYGYGEVTLSDVVVNLRSLLSVDHRGELTERSVPCGGQSDLAIRLAFQITGWLTGIWDPLPDVFGSDFRLKGSLPPRHRAGIRPDPILHNTELSIKNWQHQPVHHVANRFGKLFPDPEISLHDNTLGSRDVESACLTAAYLSFHSMEDIMGLSLEWTGTLAQHLEYDQHQKKLYVFKYPSICLLLCRDSPQTLLSSVFKQQRGHPSSQSNSSLQEMEWDGHLAEVLLSYPLIFARNRRSRKSIRRRIVELGEEGDPLLKILCTARNTSDEMKFLYKELNAEPAEDYVPIAEFPFLSKKLIQLQKANSGRNPYSLRRLWNDRRNPHAWLALWGALTALIITTLTLLFQALQFVFQIYIPNV